MNIIINQLQKNFGPKVAVDIENYSIQSGDMLGLVGNNGAGKTTLFRLMLDLLKADGGSVHIENIDVSRSEEWKNITGAFIDEGFLIDYLTPEEYFYFVGKMYGLTKEEVDKRVARFERFMNGEVIGQKKLIRNYFELFNKHQWKALSEMYTEGAEFKDPSFGNGTVKQSRAEFVKKYAELNQTFPDLKDSVIQVYPSGDKNIIVEFLSTGTAPDQSKFELPISTIFTIENGKITKDFTYYDNFEETK